MSVDMPENRELEIKGVKGVTILCFPETPILDDEYVEDTAERLFHLAENLHGQTLVLNFSRVPCISSRALGVMVSLYKKLTTRRKKLAVCCISSEIKELFRLVRLDNLFPTYDDEAKAIAGEKQEP